MIVEGRSTSLLYGQNIFKDGSQAYTVVIEIVNLRIAHILCVYSCGNAAELPVSSWNRVYREFLTGGRSKTPP